MQEPMVEGNFNNLGFLDLYSSTKYLGPLAISPSFGSMGDGYSVFTRPAYIYCSHLRQITSTTCFLEEQTLIYRLDEHAIVKAERTTKQTL